MGNRTRQTLQSTEERSTDTGPTTAENARSPGNQALTAQARVTLGGQADSTQGLDTPWSNAVPESTESETTAGAPVDLDQKTLARHREIELLAHTVAYNGGKWDDECRSFGLHERYELSPVQRQSNGFEAVYVRAVAPYKGPNVLAFTGSNDLADVMTDVDVDTKACEAQFESATQAVLEFVKESGPATTLTGHSLGGSLAQFAAVVARENGLPIAEVVTFNAPGIPADRVRQFIKTQRATGQPVEVTHYTRAEDPVSHVGEAILPGTHVKVSTDALSKDGDIVKAHTQYFITGEAGGQMKVQGDTANVAERDQDKRDREQVELGRRFLGAMLVQLSRELGIKEPVTTVVKMLGVMSTPAVLPIVVWKATEIRRIINHAFSEVRVAFKQIKSPALKETLFNKLEKHQGLLETLVGELESEGERRADKMCREQADKRRDRIFNELQLPIGGAPGGDVGEAMHPSVHWDSAIEPFLPWTVRDTIFQDTLLRDMGDRKVDILALVEADFRKRLAADPHYGDGPSAEQEFERKGGDGVGTDAGGVI